MTTYYWFGGAGNWSSTAKWSLTSGGPTAASAVPGAGDTAVFDANSGLVGAVATVDTAVTIATLTLTPGATIGFSTIAITASLTVTGLFSMSGTAGNQRFLICGNTYGLATDFSVGSASGLSDIDFCDLRVIGAAAPLSGTRIGDLRGVTGVTFSATKQVYWVTAAGGNWSGNNWSDATGNPANTIYFPLAQDTAKIVNAGLNTSATVTMDAPIPYTGAVDMSGRTTAMILATTAFTIYGDWKNGTGTGFSGIAALTFSGRNTQSITSASRTFTQPITIDTYGGTVQLVDGLSIIANPITINNGTFTTNGQPISAESFSSSNSNVRAINLGASTVTLSGANGLTFSTNTNLTFNAGTSTINCTSTTSVAFNGGGLSFNNLSFTGTTAVTHTVTGANTFANLTFTAPAATGLMGCTFAANQTITNTLTCAGASAIRRIFLRSATVGTQRTLTCAAVSAQDCDFRDIAIAGAAAPYNAGSLRVGDCGGNAGITFPAGVPKYWNLGGNVNWSSTGWATTSGGSPAANNFPLAQDTATFNAASGTIGTITIDAAWNIGTVDMTGRVVTTFPMTLTTVSSNAPTVYGSWLFDTGVTSTSAPGTITFSGRGTQTITSRGITFGCPVTINSPTGTVQLADQLTLGATRALTLTSGTFDAVTYPVSVGLVSLAAGTLRMGSNTWTLSGTGSVWSFTGGTLYKGTANIVLSDTSTTARTFSGGGQSYNKLTIGGATGISTLNITGSNQFTEIASTKTVAHTIALSTTTQTVGAWTVTGTVGNVVTVTGTATLTIAGARVSGVDYLAMGTTAISTTSPGEFYAGANSTGTGTGVILTAAPAAVTRWWRGGNGTWDATTTTNWSSSVGDVRPASVPTSADNVVFDSVSNATAYTVTCTATQLRCASLTIAGPATGNLTFAGTAPLAIHGNVTLPATGMTRTYSGILTLTGSATGKTFTTNGVLLNSALTINGVGCGWTFGSNVDVSSSNLTITNGSFNTGNYNFSGGALNSNNFNTRSITFGSSTMTFSAATVINFGSTTPINLTFNAGTSTITSNGTSMIVTSVGLTYYNVNHTGTVVGNFQITGGQNTFTNITVSGLTVAGVKTVQFAADQTISGTLTLSAGTDATMRMLMQSDVLGTTRTLTCGSISAQDTDFRDITIAGAAAPYNASSLRIGDCKGNSGITFAAGVPKYWNLAGGGNWGGAIAWATTSGGTPAINNFPLAQDTAWIESTGLTSGNTITMNAAYNIGTIDMSGRTTNTMILATGTTTPAVYGNWINGSGCSFTGTGAITFAGRGSQTITSAGAATFTQPFTINSPGGSVTLADAFSTSVSSLSAIFLTVGTFDANNKNITLSGATGGFTASGTVARTLYVGSGTWTIAGSGNSWNISTATNLTVTGTGTIKMTNASAKSFLGGGASYSGITLDQSGAGQLNITGNNTFGNITNTYSATGATTINFAATSTTMSQFTAAGTAGNLLTISGTSAASPATLILTSGTVNSNYLAVSNIKAYATTSTWYAGANSTNGGTLGWIFTASSVTASRSFGWIIT
jgi:fibronectin-binding autotransporter adhesin